MERTKKAITTAVICALAMLSALLIAGVWIINGERAKNSDEMELTYRHALYDLCDSVANIEVNLSKLMITGGERQTAVVLADIRSQAELAENSLAILPLDVKEAEMPAKFFNQIADWSTAYCGAVAGGRAIDGFKAQAKLLHATAKRMQEGLGEVMQSGGRITSRIGEGRLFGVGANFALSDKEHNSFEYPELIYDGAFSDAKKHCFSALDKLSEVSVEQAVALAESKLGLTSAECLGLTHGKTDVYEIAGVVGGENALASVTKKGGLIIGFNRTKQVKTVELSEEKAIELALDRAAELGYENLAPVWKSAENGVAFINLAPKVNGIVYYADLVKVKIALDDGTLLGVEASGYCRFRHGGDEAPTISEATARALAGRELSVEKVTLASVPSGDDETLCYELFGSYEDMRYFVYVNAYDGTLERVLRVVSDSSGDMVM